MITTLLLAVAVQSTLTHDFASQPVRHDADDPAIWHHPTRPERSLILGTDKEYQTGGLYVFDVNGRVVQTFSPIDRPNNVDVAYDFSLGGTTVDLAVVTERGRERLRIFSIERSTGVLRDVTGATRVFADRAGDEAAPMGITLYRRSRDGAQFAIVGSKSGPDGGYLYQYRLVENGGRIDLRFVRRFGQFSGVKEIEALAVDHHHGFLYASDERAGVRKYHADPDHPQANQEIAFFGTEGYQQDHEGLAILDLGDGEGYLLSIDQLSGGSRLFVYDRVPTADGVPPLVTIVQLDSDDTDGIEVTTRSLGNRLPQGALVAMNSRDRNFLIYDVRRLLEAIRG